MIIGWLRGAAMAMDKPNCWSHQLHLLPNSFREDMPSVSLIAFLGMLAMIYWGLMTHSWWLIKLLINPQLVEHLYLYHLVPVSHPEKTQTPGWLIATRGYTKDGRATSKKRRSKSTRARARPWHLSTSVKPRETWGLRRWYFMIDTG